MPAPTPPPLISPRSPRVVAARKLGKRAVRGDQRRFLAEGPQAVREAVAYGASAAPRTHGDGGARGPLTGAAAQPEQPAQPALPALVELFVTAQAAERYADLVADARQQGVRVHFADDAVIAGIATTVSPQGLVGVCRFLHVPLDAVLTARPRLVAVLAHVRDPGNAGTVLRCADAAGADAVVFTDASVDVYNPKAVRASTGSLFHLPVAVEVPVEHAVRQLRTAGLRVLAADGAGPHDLDTELDRGRMGAPTAWLFGNEAWGLDEETRALADAVVRVPIHGHAESLNLATAAAVCLFASARAQRAAGGCRSVTDA